MKFQVGDLVWFHHPGSINIGILAEINNSIFKPTFWIKWLIKPEGHGTNSNGLSCYAAVWLEKVS